MNNDEKQRLEKLLWKFDLPEHRKMITTVHNLRWLLRNLGVRNSENPKFDETISLIKKMLVEKNGIRKDT